MKIPRDITGTELAKILSKFGYKVTRQKGSHIRISTTTNGEHHVTIPNHNPIKVGTLSSILKDVANHLGVSKEELFK